MDFELRLVDGPLAPRRIALPPRGDLVVGRGRQTDLKIPDPQLSRRHCVFRCGGDEVTLEDLGSQNGSFVNGVQAKAAPLEPGDRVAFGATVAKLIVAEPAVPSRASPGDIPGFEVVDRYAEGAFGAVVKARHVATGRLVALKLIKEDLARDKREMKRFLREVRAVASLDHPSIARIEGAGDFEGTHYIVMELIEGESLMDRMAREGKIAWRDALAIGRAVACALEHAYEQGIVHRDVKPGNILLPPGGPPKLVDFGIAKHLGASLLTMPGEGLGTLAYMAPEQARHAWVADQRADVYGLAATLYHAIGGRPPFPARTPQELILKLWNDRPAPLRSLVPDVPKEVEYVVDRCLDKEPETRIQTPGEMRDAIDRCLAL